MQIIVDVEAGGGKDPSPGPLAAGIGILSAQGPRQLDPAGSGLEIGRVLVVNRLEMAREVGLDGDRQHCEAVPVALPGMHRDLVAREIEVFRPEPRVLEKVKARAVEDDGHEAGDAVNLG